MFAIIKTGGKQYTVKAGQILKVEKILGSKGDDVKLKNVIAISEGKNITFGNPTIKDASVTAKILEQARDKKIIVFKKRRRQNYRLTQGHRQYITILKIHSILYNGKKATTSIEDSNNKKTKTKSKKDEKGIEKKSDIKIVKKTSSVKKQLSKKVTKKVTKTKKTK